MSKYSNELKLEIINYYFNNSVSYREIAKKFNIPSHKTIEKWIKKYSKHGISGLSKNQRASYSGDFKINVLEYMNENHLSFSQTAIHFNLAGAFVIEKWERIYYEKGPQALYKEQRGIARKMSSNKQKNRKKLTREEELVEENKRLKMENEYLKKLNALVQERIKRENKKK